MFIRKTRLVLLPVVASAATLASAQSLPNRVAAGEVRTDSAVLWARTLARGEVQFEVATDPDFQDIVTEGSQLVNTTAVPAKLRINGLEPGTQYFYRATDRAGAVDTGRFRTAHPPESRHGLRFGISGDARGDQLPYPSVSNAADRDLDFFVHLGDTIYADIESPALPGVEQAKSLTEFRKKHSEVFSEFRERNFLGALRSTTAFLATIDDHEVTNDFAGGAHPSSDPRFDQTGEFINETMLYRNGLQAFVDYNPLFPTYYGATGDARTGGKRKLYRHYVYGLDAAICVLDARSFRDEGLEPADPTDQQDILRFLMESFDPTRTMLARQQVTDLKADLLAADQAGVLWKFVIVPEPIQNLGVLAASDRFEGYAAERTEILDFITKNDIDNVVFVAADVHGTLINNITYQEAFGQPQIPTTAFEITTGPVAFDAPFGPTVVEIAFQLGLLTQQELDFYNSLPIEGKDLFVQQLVDSQLAPLGYDAIGLEGSPLDVTLIEGGYTATHVYGWTEFDIDATTGELVVTTYGSVPDDLGTAPRIFSQFSVKPR